MINNIVYDHLSAGSSLNRISLLLRSYQKIRSLTNLEIANLKEAALYRNYGLAAFFYWIEEFDLKEYKVMKQVINSIDFREYLNLSNFDKIDIHDK